MVVSRRVQLLSRRSPPALSPLPDCGNGRLYYAPYNKRAIAAGKKASYFFPDELEVRIIPRYVTRSVQCLVCAVSRSRTEAENLTARSPFAGRTGDEPEREIESRIPLAYRVFMVFVVVLPKMLIAIALLFFGGKLVLRSDDSAEVIMNSLAAYFVAGTTTMP
jgi:hypothetical protein